MTQAVTNTLNNLEQILSVKQDSQKLTAPASSGMDKAKEFTKVFESTLNKDVSTINDLKTELKSEKLTTEDVSITSEEFKEILKQATDEANVETSLDLTLARDINEIISQLKEAIENATEIVEEGSEEEIVVDDLENAEEMLVEQQENNQEELTDEEDVSTQEQNVSFGQVITFVDKTTASIDVQDSLKFSEKEDSREGFEKVDMTAEEVVDFAENLLDDVVSLKTKELPSQNEVELPLDENVMKDLKLESISAELDTTGGSDLMQNQSPEEYAVKAMINQDVDVFEIKLDSTQNTQTIPQVQTKPVDVNPSRILEQITKHFEGLQNNSKVNIVLNPESLGKVNIQLLSSKEGLTAQFTVTTQEARDLLTKGLDGLKESLGAHGVAVDNVSVKVADSQKSEYRQDWTEQEGSRGGNKGQGQPNREEKEKGLFEKMMAQTVEDENGNV